MTFLQWTTILQRRKWQSNLSLIIQEEFLDAGTFLVLVINLVIIMIMGGG